MKTRFLIFLLLPLLILNACAGSAPKIAPAEIHYGEDICAECGMIISDARFASSYTIEFNEGSYQSLAFDDIGDMLASEAKHPEHQIVGWWVHDYNSEAWIEAQKAYFVLADSFQTPMAHGIAACSTSESAQKLAQEMKGDVMQWDELRAK